MKEYGIVKSWTELFTVDLSGYISRVFGFRESGHVLFKEQWRGNDKRDDTELSSYDPESQQVKKLGIPGWTVYFCTDNYVENLVLLDKPNVVRSQWVVSRKKKFSSPSPQSNQIGAVGLQGVVKELPLADDIDRVDSEEERATDKETICELKRAIVHQQAAMTQQKEEMDFLKIKMATLKSEMATLKSQAFSRKIKIKIKSQALSVRQSSNQVEKMSSGVGDVGSP